MRDKRRGSDNPGNPFGRRPASNGTNGVHPEGMRTRSIPFDDVNEPIDLVAVQADDELINALAGGMTVSAPGLEGYGHDDRVAALLSAWKADVDAEPIPDLVDVETAVTAVKQGRSGRRARHLVPLAGAAALIVIAIAGVSITAQEARPGDALWAVSKVLYQERAESVEAAAVVEQAQQKAKDALARGDTTMAAQEVDRAQAAVAVVRAEDGQVDARREAGLPAGEGGGDPAGHAGRPGRPARRPRRTARAPTPKDGRHHRNPRNDPRFDPRTAETPSTPVTPPPPSTDPATPPSTAPSQPGAPGAAGTVGLRSRPRCRGGVRPAGHRHQLSGEPRRPRSPRGGRGRRWFSGRDQPSDSTASA